MATKELKTIVEDESIKPKKQSALGIGITTLVTIMVILLLVAFAILALVSAQSNHHLSQMAATQAEEYYAADGEATAWYAQLDDFVGTLDGSMDDYAAQLQGAGYEIETTSNGELRVIHSFAINENRTMMVAIGINEDKTTTIRQWHS